MAVLSFHPGETLVLNFIIPFDRYDVQAVSLTFRDQDAVVFEALAESVVKEGEDGEKGVRVGYTLTQDESLMFQEYSDYTMQLNVFSFNGSRATSKEMKIRTMSQHLIEPGYQTIQTPPDVAVTRSISQSDLTDYNDLINKPIVNGVVLTHQVDLFYSMSNAQIDSVISEFLAGENSTVVPTEPAIEDPTEPVAEEPADPGNSTDPSGGDEVPVDSEEIPVGSDEGLPTEPWDGN